MARTRNKATTEKKTEVLDEAAEMAALEAALNEGSEMTIDDSDFVQVDEKELAKALSATEANEKANEAATAAPTTEAASSTETPPVVAQVKAKTAPNATRDANVFAKEVSTILGENAALDSEEGEMTETQLMDLMRDVTQIKVREKILNLCHHVMSGRKLNGYTEIAAKILIAHQLDGCKPVTSADIKKGYEAAGYKPGTVNAQQGQMMSLFRAMGMATAKDRGILIPNANSVILDVLASS